MKIHCFTFDFVNGLVSVKDTKSGLCVNIPKEIWLKIWNEVKYGEFVWDYRDFRNKTKLNVSCTEIRSVLNDIRSLDVAIHIEKFDITENWEKLNSFTSEI